MKRILTNSNFSMWAEMVSAPAKPTEYVEASVERMMEYLNPYVENVKNIKFKYHAQNKIELISFSTPEEEQAYINAWEDYLLAVAKIEERDGEGAGGKFMILVQFLKFRQAAELIRAPYLAKRLYSIVYDNNRSAICACNFKETISKIVSILVLDYKVPRDEISLIWGGQVSKKKKKTLSREEMLKVKELFTLEDLDMLRDLGIESELEELNTTNEENNELEKRLKSNRDLLQLGVQNKNERQRNIDNFQNDKSKFCLFTFKSGGVGLSLHQETPQNRVRESLLAPTYSAIELVQGLGRAARLTSCSDTEQTVIFYANTIEVRVSLIASKKLKCLSKAVQKKESWDTVIFGVSKPEYKEDYESDDAEQQESEEDSDSVLAGGGSMEEESENNNDSSEEEVKI